MATEILPSGIRRHEIDGYVLREVAPLAEPSTVAAYLALQEFEASSLLGEVYHLAISSQRALVLTGPVTEHWTPASDSTGVCPISSKSDQAVVAAKIRAVGY